MLRLKLLRSKLLRSKILIYHCSTSWHVVCKPISFLVPVLVFYYYATNYHKFTGLNPHTFISQVLQVRTEKAMATHSSTLAWKIPWMDEPGRLQSRESLGVGHD